MLLPFPKAGTLALTAALALLLMLVVACAPAATPMPIPTATPVPTAIPTTSETTATPNQEFATPEPTATPTFPSWTFSERVDDITDARTVTIKLRAHKSTVGPMPALQIICSNEEGWKAIVIDWGVEIASLITTQPLPVSWHVDGEITPSQSWPTGTDEGGDAQVTYRSFRPLSAVDGFGAMPGRRVDEYIKDLRRADKIVATVYPKDGPKDGDSIKAVWYTSEFAEAYQRIAEECNLTIP